MVKKAITHLKLDRGNAGKLHTLDTLATEHQCVVQAYVNWLTAHGARQPDKYANIPEAEIPTPLSERWQRCAWQPACGIVQSWYSNGRENPPVLRNVCLQANSHVVVIEPSQTHPFDYWRRVSSLKKGHPVRIPLRLYENAKETLAQFPKRCSGVTLNRQDGVWYATFVVERRGPKPASTRVVGVDIGMVSMLSSSEGKRHGQVSLELRRRIEGAHTKRRRKQKLNACLRACLRIWFDWSCGPYFETKNTRTGMISVSSVSTKPHLAVRRQPVFGFKAESGPSFAFSSLPPALPVV